MMTAAAFPAIAEPVTPHEWFALLASIEVDIARADIENRTIPKLDREDRAFVRRMANEMTVDPDAKPTPAQGKWLLAIRAWIDAAK